MDWKNVIVGILIGTIVGIAGTFFVLQGRISKLEGIVEQLRIDSKQIKSGDSQPESSTQTKSGDSQPESYPSWPNSPDGKYQAVRIGSGNNIHFQVQEIGTGRIVFTTHAQYDTPNDVKAGLFSPDSKKIAAAYHYGHAGNYTWVGIWDIESGNLRDKRKKAGWTTDIYWVFKKENN